ncbi:MAG: crotonase/enoyl-CoA hydratase family protein [Oceanospirillaceae bacterium]|nr:crotonase/enoyl-CoA hydratase family protein [Oceanospirillaceae bacterium]MCP5349605.1 crotonase/enoyl-CoA hydratase family protein [Oceanospirillaceae bacterium]
MSQVLIEKRGHILDICLNRPEKYNALSFAMYQDMAYAYGEFAEDKNLRVAVIHANGDHFCAGLQLDDWASVFANGKGVQLKAGQKDPFGIAGEAVNKPVIIALQGISFTCAVELMLNADIRIAADNCRFAQLEVQRGFHACGGATLRLPMEIGWGNAQRYLLTGDEWNAAQALQWGLVQEVLPASEILTKSMQIAERICKAAPLGVQGSLKSSRYLRAALEKEAIHNMFRDLQPIMASQDMQEGISAYLQRREPNYTGK